MRLLAIDTATEACSAALYLDGEALTRFEIAPRRHADLILPMMDGLLAEAGLRLCDLDALAFGRGPGAFTGVRIATGVIQGAAFGAGLSVVRVSTLAALAQHAVRELGGQRIVAAFDARMGEIYCGAYERDADDLVTPVSAEVVATPEAVTLPGGGGWWGVGSGWGTYGDQLERRLGNRLERIEPGLACHALDVALLAVRGFEQGEAVSPEKALPVYLRDQVAHRPG